MDAESEDDGVPLIQTAKRPKTHAQNLSLPENREDKENDNEPNGADVTKLSSVFAENPN